MKGSAIATKVAATSDRTALKHLKIVFDLVYSLTAYACIERVLPQLVRKANGLHSLVYSFALPF